MRQCWLETEASSSTMSFARARPIEIALSSLRGSTSPRRAPRVNASTGLSMRRTVRSMGSPATSMRVRTVLGNLSACTVSSRVGPGGGGGAGSGLPGRRPTRAPPEDPLLDAAHPDAEDGDERLLRYLQTILEVERAVFVLAVRDEQQSAPRPRRVAQIAAGVVERVVEGGEPSGHLQAVDGASDRFHVGRACLDEPRLIVEGEYGHLTAGRQGL